MKKIKALLFAIIGIGFSVVVFKAGYRMAGRQTEIIRKYYMQRAAWLAITIDTIERMRIGDIEVAERQLRMAGCLEAMEYLESKFCVRDSADSLWFIYSKELCEIESMLPTDEKSVIQQKFEFLMKCVMLEKEE